MRAKPKGCPRKTSRSNPIPIPATSAAWSGGRGIPPSKSCVPSPKPLVATWPPSVAGCPKRMKTFSQWVGASAGQTKPSALQPLLFQLSTTQPAPSGHVQTLRLHGSTPGLHGLTLRLPDPTSRLDELPLRLHRATLRLAEATPRLPLQTLRLGGLSARLHDLSPRLDRAVPPLHERTSRLPEPTPRPGKAAPLNSLFAQP